MILGHLLQTIALLLCLLLLQVIVKLTKPVLLVFFVANFIVASLHFRKSVQFVTN